MILDKDIPSIGSQGHFGAGIQGALNKAYRRMLNGRPLLVDEKGAAVTELRTGGLRDVYDHMSADWNELLETSHLLDKDGKPMKRARETQDAYSCYMDFPPAEITWVSRKQLLEGTWTLSRLERLRAWWNRHRHDGRGFGLGFDLYQFYEGTTWHLDIYAGPLTFELEL